MKYQDFKNQIKEFPIFSASLASRVGPNEQLLRNQLSGWKRRGLLRELKRGLYVLNENDRKITPSRMFLANQLYPPSYLSTDYALMYYDLIPERVADLTSVTTRKTASFENSFGRFIYQHVGIIAFRGFLEKKDENNYSFMIATPEKAIVDFIYLNLSRFERGKSDVFEQSFRFQNLAQLDLGKMKEFTRFFRSKKLCDIMDMLETSIAEGRKNA